MKITQIYSKQAYYFDSFLFDHDVCLLIRSSVLLTIFGTFLVLNTKTMIRKCDLLSLSLDPFLKIIIPRSLQCRLLDNSKVPWLFLPLPAPSFLFEVIRSHVLCGVLVSVSISVGCPCWLLRCYSDPVPLHVIHMLQVPHSVVCTLLKNFFLK